MLIAFEGPDTAGRSDSAANIGHLVGETARPMTLEEYSNASDLLQKEQGLVHAFSGVDWITQLAHGLSQPILAYGAPDTHLVFKLGPSITNHSSSLNAIYRNVASAISYLNEVNNFSVFKTVSIMEVMDARQSWSYLQSLVSFSSPVHSWTDIRHRLVRSDEDLVELLAWEDQRRG